MTPRNSLILPERVKPGNVFVVLSQFCHGSGAMRHGGVSVGDFRGPRRTAIPNEGPSRMNSSFLGVAAAIALLAAAPASATEAGPTISYVPKSLAESVINHGPWTLHESVANFVHNASGIIPITAGTTRRSPATIWATITQSAGSRCNSRAATCVAPIKTDAGGVVRAGARSTPSLWSRQRADPPDDLSTSHSYDVGVNATSYIGRPSFGGSR
jgi:hypothetical protein